MGVSGGTLVEEQQSGGWAFVFERGRVFSARGAGRVRVAFECLNMDKSRFRGGTFDPLAGDFPNMSSHPWLRIRKFHAAGRPEPRSWSRFH